MTFAIKDPEHFPCGCPRSEENTYRGSRNTKRCLFHTRRRELERRRQQKAERLERRTAQEVDASSAVMRLESALRRWPVTVEAWQE